MRLYDRVNMKSVIIVTSLAAVVSVAAGGVGGVSTGTLIIRAVLFALVFAAGTVLINLVVDTFLPELKTKESDGEGESAGEEVGRGQNVNIVMDDGEGAVAGDSALETLEGEALEGETVTRSGESQPVVDMASSGVRDRPSGTEEVAPSSGAELPDIGVFSSISEDEEDDVPEAVSLDATESPQAEGMKSRFASMQTNDEDKIEFFQNNTTAEDLAKGVRTMLKSDEKG